MLTLVLSLGGLLHGLFDLVVGCALLDAAGQVDDGDIAGRHTHGHARKLAVQAWDDLADCLGRAGRGRDDVLGSRTATAPILAGWAVDGLLGRSVGVDGGHQTLDEPVLVVDDLGEWCEAVGRAGGVGDDLDLGLVLLVVHAHDEHWCIGGGSRDDHLLRAALQVSLGLIGGGEDTSGLDDIFGAGLAPRDVGWFSLHVEADFLAIHYEVLAVDFDVALEDAVLGVVSEHVCLDIAIGVSGAHGCVFYRKWSCIVCSRPYRGRTHGVVWLNEGVVASNNFDVTMLDPILNQLCAGSVHVSMTYALRKTIRPIRPKPLIPTYTTESEPSTPISSMPEALTLTDMVAGCGGKLSYLLQY